MTTSDIMKRQLETAHPIHRDELSAPTICGRDRWDRITYAAILRDDQHTQRRERGQ